MSSRPPDTAPPAPATAPPAPAVELPAATSPPSALPDPGAPSALNPFPGPRPYRAEDRRRFHGRDDPAKKLLRRMLAHPCITLYGPSGAGKSSLMQAAVIPALLEEHAFRIVRVDAWPAGEAPVPWLVRELWNGLDLGAPPADLGSSERALAALDQAVQLAEQRSDRPILIYLDQLEQLFFPGRPPGEARALIEAADRLAHQPIRGLSLVLALREDYLGRFRDRARGRPELLDHGFRLGPLTVAEMTRAVGRVAAESGQSWDETYTRKLMLDVRTPGQLESEEAEVQAAFGQIVCRALWERQARARLRPPSPEGPGSLPLPRSPLTVAGVPLELGERVLYFHKPGSPSLPAWTALLGIFVCALGPQVIRLGPIGSVLLIPVCLLGVLLVVRALRSEKTRSRAEVVTTRRVILVSLAGKVSWMPLADVAEVSSAGPVNRRGRRLDSMSRADPEYWPQARKVRVLGRSGARLELDASRARELGPLQLLLITTGYAEKAPNVAYQA
jgi:hypothetical protein